MNAAEARGVRLVLQSFPGIEPEYEEKQASKERHPAASKPALAPIPSLFDQPAKTHMAGKETERSAKPHDLSGLRLGVLGALVRAGERGLTGTEADEAVNRPRPSGSSRLSELENWGYAIPTTARRLSPSKRPQIVWIATPEGREAYEVASRLNARAS